MKEKSKALKIIENIDIAVASIAFIILVVLTCSGVVMRYILGNPYTWLEEVQLFCMVWIVFAASGAAFRTGSHVAIEMIVELLPEKVQRIIEILIDIVVVIVIGYLFKQSIGFVQLFALNGRGTSMLNIPYALIYGIAPISYILMILSYFTTKYFRREEKEGISE